MQAVRAAGHRVLPLPGASALTAAWSAAGLAEGPVTFVGFLPAKRAQAVETLSRHAASDAHLVFYEAPHRIVDTLAMLAECLPDRVHCLVARELTKRFEAIERVALGDAAAWIRADPQRQRGEFVVIVEAGPGSRDQDRGLARARPVLEKLCAALSLSDAAALAAELTGVPRKTLYAEALRLRDAPA